MSLSTLIDRIVHTLHEHITIVEEARRGIALTRATRGSDKRAMLEGIERLRLSRVRLAEDLKALREPLMELGYMSSDEIEDLIALLGYYVEVAYVNELRLLREAMDLVDVSSDIEDLEDLRREARVILFNLISRSSSHGNP